MGAASERFRFQQRAPSPFRTIIASIAKQLAEQKLDCFVASLLATTVWQSDGALHPSPFCGVETSEARSWVARSAGWG